MNKAVLELRMGWFGGAVRTGPAAALTLRPVTASEQHNSHDLTSSLYPGCIQMSLNCSFFGLKIPNCLVRK